MLRPFELHAHFAHLQIAIKCVLHVLCATQLAWILKPIETVRNLGSKSANIPARPLRIGKEWLV